MAEWVSPTASAGPQVVLHVGCGPRQFDTLHARFRGPAWREVRLDIDQRVQPDVVASITDMPMVGSASVDAVWSSHNLEHLHAFEVPQALAEFLRVLKPGGCALIAVPDLQRAAELVAAEQAEAAAYVSPAGPITPLDMIFGHRVQTQSNPFMAHRTGFTARTLIQALAQAGFRRVQLERHEFELLAEASKGTPP